MMRLTLRTLLAYLDGILEPEDRDDLKVKIEQSEFASDLLHRSRDVMRRLRLGAPAVTDPRKGVDANSVAEYLDNTMSPEQVADFERLCLESDIQLAEVASCHQILTMVLGEPAEVRPESRARMYDIPLEADLLAIQASQGDDGPAPTELPRADVPQVEVGSTQATHVPDYLRPSLVEKHGRKLALAATVLVAGMVWLFWPAKKPQLPPEVAQNGRDSQLELPSVDEGENGEISEPGESTLSGNEAAENVPRERSNGLSAAPPFEPDDTDGQGINTPPLQAGQQFADSLEGADADAIPPLPPELNELTVDTRSDREDSPVGTAPLIEDSIRSPLEDTSVTTPGNLVAPALPTPDGNVPSLPNSEDSSSTPNVAGSDALATPDDITFERSMDAVDSDAPLTTTAVVNPLETELLSHVATYISTGELLLRYDTQLNAWMRLAPLAHLSEGDQLLALPGSRPVFTLPSTKLTIQFQPSTRVVLAEEDAGGLPNLGGQVAPVGLTVLYGRVVMLNPSPSGDWVGMRIRLGDRVFGVELNGGTTVAVDVRRRLPPGTNPLENVGGMIADLYAISATQDSGEQVRWRMDEFVQTVQTPAHWQVIDDEVRAIQPLVDVPRWINEDTVPLLDRLAVGVTEPAIAIDRPARLSLTELADSPIAQRRREVKALLAETSIQVGNFEPFVKSLNDMSQSQAWDEHIDVLRGAMALDPKVASQIRDAFRSYKGQQAGDERFRLLWGYDKQQLESGALEQLINYLDHESLDLRVLAFNNLHLATGKKLYYSPHDRPEVREGPVREWRKRLMAGDLDVRPQGTGS